MEIAYFVARFCGIYAENDQNNFNFLVVFYRKFLVAINFINAYVTKFTQWDMRCELQADFEFQSQWYFHERVE